jgi:hypothetical protein
MTGTTLIANCHDRITANKVAIDSINLDLSCRERIELMIAEGLRSVLHSNATSDSRKLLVVSGF